MASEYYFPKLNLFHVYTAGSYNVLSDEVSVSGFSSGGFMAVQFHIAFSKSLMGVGAISGGM